MKVPQATAEGSTVLTGNLTWIDSRYTVSGSRPGRSCDSRRWKPEAQGPEFPDAIPQVDDDAAARKKDLPLELFDEAEVYEKYMEDEWLMACELQTKAKPGSANAYILHYKMGKYVRVPVFVLGFDYEKQKYVCEVIASGEKKLVGRLAICFSLEDEAMYEQRLSTCKTKRANAYLTRKLTDIMEAIPSETIAPMSGEMKTKLIRMVLQNARLEAPEDYVQALRELMLSAESSYILAIKFAILKEQMFERNGFPDAHLVDETSEFADMMRVFLPKPAPERGQIVSSKDVWSVKDACGALAKHMLF